MSDDDVPWTPPSTPVAPPAPARLGLPRFARIAIVAGVVLVALIGIGVLVSNDDSAQKRVEAYLHGEGQKEFVASDVQFAATFPEIPDRTTKKLDVAGQQVELVFYSSGSNVRLFGVGALDIPPGTAFDLNMAVNGSAAAAKGHVERSSLVTFNGMPAAEAVIAAEHGLFVKTLIVQAPKRIYEVEVIGKDNPPAGYDRFKSSFRILPT